MVAGFQLHDLLRASSQVSVIGCHLIYSEDYHFNFINEDEKPLERYLKYCVLVF